MKKPITRRHFLTQMTAAVSSAALMGNAAAETTSRKKTNSPKPYRPTQAEQRKNALRQQAYDALVRRPVLKTSIDPHWFDDSKHFWYRNDGRDGTLEFIRVDAAQGVRQAAFDHKQLANGLSKASGKSVEADALPFDAIAYTPDNSAVSFAVNGQEWQCDLATYICTKSAAVGEKRTGQQPAGRTLQRRVRRRLRAIAGRPLGSLHQR